MGRQAEKNWKNSRSRNASKTKNIEANKTTDLITRFWSQYDTNSFQNSFLITHWIHNLAEQAVSKRFCLFTAVFKLQNPFTSLHVFAGVVFVNNFPAFVANSWLAKVELHFVHSQ